MKFKATITFEYNVYPKAYPDGSSVGKMIQIDKDNFEEDPEIIFAMLEDTMYKVNIEEMEETK